ncbi:hypothetical protein D6817_04705 [Candidatus Pacearchaeota archaeon]|nr:MAG: hypothetical protein D6817_04705 [Candidatus Pacearchaeota archaeon]
MSPEMPWKCVCGHVEFSEAVPEDCPKCFRVGSFQKVSEEMLKELEEEEVLSIYQQMDEEMEDEDGEED